VEYTGAHERDAAARGYLEGVALVELADLDGGLVGLAHLPGGTPAVSWQRGALGVFDTAPPQKIGMLDGVFHPQDWNVPSKLASHWYR
jgi:hypothetical protein